MTNRIDVVTNALLSVDSLCCERDDRCLFSGLSFSADAGEILQITGPNGAGKTTLLRILTGLYRDYEGDVYYQGQTIGSSSGSYQANLAALLHAPAIKPNLSALENLRFSLSLTVGSNEAALFDTLARLNLQGFEHSPARSLSAGQQRRIALARLLLSAADIWILDEPFTAIDVDGVALLESLIADHARAGGLVILTSHHQLQIDDIRRLDLSVFTLGALT